jgi:hypothetical protein
MSTQTTTGQAAVLISSDWTAFAHIPSPDGGLIKSERRRGDTNMPGYLHRETIWYKKDVRPHDHPWSFTSLIIRGWIEETIFSRLPDGTLVISEVRRHYAGTNYSCPHGTIHMITDCDPGSITLMSIDPLVSGPMDWSSYAFDGTVARPLTPEEKKADTDLFLRRYAALNKPIV